MSDKKPCLRCERPIDPWAKLCPFCNHDQAKPAPPPSATPSPAAGYTPPAERDPKKLIAYAAGGVILLVLAFLVGMIINSDGAPKNAPEPVVEQEDKPSAPKRADTPLVPTNERGGIEQPITSAPAAAPAPGTASSEYDRTDATAVSATEYAQMAKRAQAEKKKMAVIVDPRTLTGAAYAQQTPLPPRRVAPAVPPGTVPAQPSGSQQEVVGAQPRRDERRAMRTRAVPQYQPVPPIRARGSARFDLLVGADGRVKDITVRRAIDGNTSALIGAIQSWRFKPATENGEAVASTFTVEISFGGR